MERPVLRLLLPVLLLAACGEDPAPHLPPVPDPGGGGSPVLPAARADDGGGVRSPSTRLPLPVRPVDEAQRLKGLLHMLEWGDIPLVEFAQDAVAAFPDRVAAATALAAKGDANLRSNPALLQNLLGCVKDPEFGRLLLPFLLRSLDCEDPQVRKLAVLLYSQSAGEPDFALLGRLVSDAWHPVSQAALEGFRLHPGPEAAKALREVIPGTKEFTRAAAVSTLGVLGDPDSIPLLRAEMKTAEEAGPDAFPSYLAAAQGLGRLGDEEGLEALRAYVLGRSLMKAPVPLDSPEEYWDGPEVILARAGDAGMRARLLKQVKETDEGAAASAARLLRVYPPDPEIIGAWIAASERTEWEPILEGLDGLRFAGSPDARARTLAALVAPATDRRYAAALALGRSKDPSTVKTMVERLGAEKDPAVARKICDALGILGDASAAPALLAFMEREQAPSPEMGLVAFYARQNLRGALARAAEGDLVRLAVSEKALVSVRFHAARALGQASPGEAARKALVGLLGSENTDLRAAAAEALGEAGNRAVRDDLAQAYAREPDDVVASMLRDSILRLDLGSPVAP